MKVLFVVPYPVGQAASQRYRVEQWLPLLQEQGSLYKLAPFWSQSTWPVLYKPGHIGKKALGLLAGFWRRLLLLARLPRYDYIFVHREATPVGPPWFEWVAAKVLRKKIIFDFDDAIWLPDSNRGSGWRKKLKWRHKTAQICRWSYKVSCGNDYLRNYALKYNAAAVLLPTVLDTDQVCINRKEQQTAEVAIGWIGSHSTLPYLQLLEPVLQRLERKYSFKLYIIADRPPQLQLQSVIFKQWRRGTETEDLLEFHIGLMPLPDTDWARGKCAFKALQYMALGIPAVVAGVGANLGAVADGRTGYICQTEQEWYERLEELILEPGKRAGMGAAGQEWVKARYSLQAHRHTFLSLFS
ncbi:glycosyltransferase [Pontibacter russatus]|uniref:glycosyltransferase n=1 Tax=Pontibacter russatus TaxID=2694929 RepID=UPI001379B879|nr:glycosyltransferase [Pontibacter russatus]